MSCKFVVQDNRKCIGSTGQKLWTLSSDKLLQFCRIREHVMAFKCLSSNALNSTHMHEI